MLMRLARFLTMPTSAALICVTCVAALLFALTMQYGFNIEPCVLCLWQRVPFVLAGILSFIAFMKKPYGAYTRVLLGLCALLFAVGCALAFFHTGVERHWWLGTSGCSVQPLSGASAEDLRTQLLHTVVARCDQISWTILGFSMANLNILLSGSLAFFAYLAQRKVRA